MKIIAWLAAFILLPSGMAVAASGAGAVTGGGLTVIANAPNPAGQSILKRYFEHGVSPLGLLRAALIPTLVMGLSFALLRF
jgi:Na+/H+ antiporter NhaD/arsenite permease-like protein